MNEHIYTDVFGHEVVLADTVYDMILLKHPETIDFIDRINQVLAEPDEVRRSTHSKHYWLYYRF